MTLEWEVLRIKIQLGCQSRVLQHGADTFVFKLTLTRLDDDLDEDDLDEDDLDEDDLDEDDLDSDLLWTPPMRIHLPDCYLADLATLVRRIQMKSPSIGRKLNISLPLRC